MNPITGNFASWIKSFIGSSTKHDYYKDFGYPEHLTFSDFYRMYTRNGLAHAAVKLTTLKTWESNPVLASGNAAADTGLMDALARLGAWDKIADADDMALVGGYAGVILRFADSKRWNEPVENVGGLDALVEIIPAWRGQLTVSEWHIDETDADNYGRPKMWLFNESAVQVGDNNPGRAFSVHPDRVAVWSENGTVQAHSLLMAGFNDLSTCEKVSGAGGEGFWKSARGALKITVDKDMEIPRSQDEREAYTKGLNDKIEAFAAGFDKNLFLNGMNAEAMPVALPQPEEFHLVPLSQFAASVMIPMKILVGSQTGERASTEDAQQWNKTINARRVRWCKPAIMKLVGKLVKAGALLDLPWEIEWDDLTEANPSEKLERADKMSSINERSYRSGGGEVFGAEEIRAEAGYYDPPPASGVSDAENGLPDVV